MKLLRFIDKVLWIPLVICIALITLPIFFQDTTPQLGGRNALVNVSYSFIAAFIFYVLIDALKRMREAQALAPYMRQQISWLKGDVISICREAARIAGETLAEDWVFNAEDMDEIFKKVTWLSEANMVDQNLKKLTFGHYLQHYAGRTRKCLNNVFGFSFFLGSEGARKTAELQRDGYQKHIEMMSGLIKDSRMDFLTSTLKKHSEMLEDLENWAKKNQFL